MFSRWNIFFVWMRELSAIVLVTLVTINALVNQ